MRPAVTCSCCCGSGSIPLPEGLWSTLQRVANHPTLTSDLQEPGITRNAINNRLIALEQLGLVRRAGKQGKWILWTRSNPP